MSGFSSFMGVNKGIGALGSLTAGISDSAAIKAQGEFEAQQLQFNADLSQLQHDDALRRGKKDALKAKHQAKRMIGSQRAAMAAQGIVVDSDTAAQIQEDTLVLGAENAQQIKNNSYREAFGFKVQALDLKGQARMAQLSSKQKARNTLLTASLSMVSGLAESAAHFHDRAMQIKGKKDKERKRKAEKDKAAKRTIYRDELPESFKFATPTALTAMRGIGTRA